MLAHLAETRDAAGYEPEWNLVLANYQAAIEGFQGVTNRLKEHIDNRTWPTDHELTREKFARARLVAARRRLLGKWLGHALPSFGQ